MGQTSTVGSHKTTVATDSTGTTHVTYHSTVVVSFNMDYIMLRTGGYKSVTTKTRMNQASNQFGLGYSVFQKNYDWFVRIGGEDYPFDGNEIIIDRFACKVKETAQ